MKFAVIDIGSNTAKAEIYKYKNNALKLKLKEVRRDMIADHKDGGSLDSDGVSILINIMKEFALICRQNEVEKIFPYATQSLRGIDNADDRARKRQGSALTRSDASTAPCPALCPTWAEALRR